jgi:hypothetical protein
MGNAVELRFIGVVLPNGTVAHWMRFSPTWRAGTRGETVCGKAGTLEYDTMGNPECGPCRWELDKIYAMGKS